MAIDEAVTRVVRGHWLLLLALIIALPVAGILYAQHQPQAFSATSRIQVGTSLASSQVEADAASARALGLATSPGVVLRALTSAGLTTDPTQFAAQHISVGRVGVSPIVTLTVTWTSAGKANQLATSLTQQVLAFSNDSGYDAEAQRIRALDDTIASLQSSRTALLPNLTEKSQVLVVQARIGAIDTTLQDDLRQRSDLIVAAASRSSSVMVDPPHVDRIVRSLAKAAVLGLLAALVLGLGLAAVLEWVRPRIRGTAAIAQSLGTTALGHLDGRRRKQPWEETVQELAGSVQLLGRAHRVRRLVLLPVVPPDDLVPGLVCAGIGRNPGKKSAPLLPCCLLEEFWHDDNEHVGVVVLSPAVLTGAQLKEARTMVTTLDLPVVGVITWAGDLADWAASPSADLIRGGRPVKAGVR
jgi:hypothetical protein